MASPIKLNPNVAGLPAYNAGMNVSAAQQKTGRTDVVGLASNENPFGCSPTVTAALRGVDPSKYADSTCTVLRGALADKLGVSSNHIVVGNGSEEMIAAVCRAASRFFSTTLTVTPGFGLHEIEPKANGAKVAKVPMTADLQFDMPGIVAALQKKPSVFFISSPSNPVGPALSRDELRQIIDAVPAETLLVLDEAYYEFRGEGMPDGLQELQESDISYVVLRTFSKAYGLAGLRVGYAVTSDDLIAKAMSAAKTPFNVNAAAQTAAVAALQDEEWMVESVAKIVSERARMAREISSLGLFSPDSRTNFLFVDVGCESNQAFEHFLNQGIVVKPWKELGYSTFIRVTVGKPADNDRFLAALRQLVAERPNFGSFR
ncbi:histidinol-phosphate transaminase [Rhizobium grahamii]|uniref:Histidinol-phosphate aminotransferase n=1 Tax=Rhizobium grahamii CCGE 502 TaxID=990285 RepID=S3HDC9_9HYPH|nr:histidinol-phosphate aminotransferase [Rhizobium grahamii CCGE 502]